MIVHLLAAAAAALVADSTLYRGSAGELEVSPPRHASAEVEVDARLDEPVWENAAVLAGFTLYEPVEGTPATEETRVLVFYTSEAIYFGFRVRDTEPGAIPAHRTERDRSAFNDDWIRIMLDTFDDQRRAYSFWVNPLGIQTDAIWLEELEPLGGPTGPKVDFNPDYVWESEGRVVEDGWVAEIRIPYVSIRFREREVQDWGLQIARGITRNGHKMSWAPLTRERSNVLAQSGALVGLRGLEPQRLIELNPVATGRRTGEVVSGGFTRGSFEPELGMNARLGISQNLILDGTYNPDFSQVEADADRVEVNERFALFYPEKRPFFLDGTEILQTAQRLVHTRRVVDPVGGAKLTGRMGGFDLAYLGAVDESPRTLHDRNHEAVFNLVRARRDLGGGSTAGILFTDRTLAGAVGYNRVVSGDLRLLLGPRYTVETQFTGSWTRRRPDDDPELRPFISAGLQRSGRNLIFRLNVDDVHPEFRAASGFVPRVGDTEVNGALELTAEGSSDGLVQRYGVEVESITFFQHRAFRDAGGPFERTLRVRPGVELRGERDVSLTLRNGHFSFRPADFAGYRVLGEEGETRPLPTPDDLSDLKGLALSPRIRVDDRLRLRGRGIVREVPLYQEGSRGIEARIGPSLTFRPDRAISVELDYTHARLWRSRDRSLYSRVDVSRLKAQYHATETIRARAIAQFDLEWRNGLEDPSTGRPLVIDGVRSREVDQGDFLTQLLVAYEPSPGTTFYAGFSRTMRGSYGYTVSGMRPVAEGLFVKASYRFRL